MPRIKCIGHNATSLEQNATEKNRWQDEMPQTSEYRVEDKGLISRSFISSFFYKYIVLLITFLYELADEERLVPFLRDESIWWRDTDIYAVFQYL